MIQGIIFDCFGVLSTGSLTHLAGLAAPENRQAVYDVNLRADYGYISHEEYARLMAELVNLSESEVERIFEEKHHRNQRLMELVRTLRSKYKTALLSNVSRGIMNSIFTSQELEELFDTVVLSYEIGVLKPAPEIYTMTATNLGIAPEACIMIDDIPRNVEGAEATGMKGIVYGSNDQLITEFTRHGVVV